MLTKNNNASDGQLIGTSILRSPIVALSLLLMTNSGGPDTPLNGGNPTLDDGVDYQNAINNQRKPGLPAASISR